MPTQQDPRTQTRPWAEPQEQPTGVPGTRGLGNVGSFEHGRRSEMAVTFMNHVFGWMAGGLALSGAVAWVVMSSAAIFSTVSSLFLPLVIGELVMVVVLSARLHKMSAATAGAMFLAYAALNGLTLGVVVAMYTGASVARVFFITSGTFGAMAVIGATTKKDLTGMGSFLMMGVIAIIIASVVNLFLASSALDWTISVVGALIFAGLTAYDVQKFKAAGYMGFATKREAGQGAIRGALNLYLDFINMFLFMLRLFGDRR
ncbi:MAG: Bax inhibitor-1/YccA family protein [Myxococcales bacterium]|nr:Bax inhibitor-1/YccA family protein [Myxococcales bacterium]